MSQPDFTFEKVNRASQACGPLVKWAIAQVHHYFIVFSKYSKSKILKTFQKILSLSI